MRAQIQRLEAKNAQLTAELESTRRELENREAALEAARREADAAVTSVSTQVKLTLGFALG